MRDEPGDASVNLAVFVQTYVVGPHLFERGADLSYHILDRSSKYAFTLGGDPLAPLH